MQIKFWYFFSVEVNRDHVFHVTFPKEWRASDLYTLFEPYGEFRDCIWYRVLINKAPTGLSTFKFSAVKAKW